MMIIRIPNVVQTDKNTPISSEPTPVTKSVKSSSPSESKIQPTTNKTTAKRKLQTEAKNSEKKKAKLQSSEMRTTLAYDGIGVCESSTSVHKEDKILSKCILCLLFVKLSYFSSKLENPISNFQ